MRARFSIPFNGDLALAEEAFASGQVAEIYLAGPGKSNLSTPFDDTGARTPRLKDIRALQGLCEEYGVKTNLLCNSATLFFADIGKLFESIRSLGKIDAVTVADPTGISRFKAEFPEKDIQASVITNLDSFHKIEQVLRLGIGTVTVAPKFARDIAALKRLGVLKKRYPDFRVKLIANYDCAYECVYAFTDYSSGVMKTQIADAGKYLRKSEIYCGSGCLSLSKSDLAGVIRCPFIRPEDLAYFEELGGVDHFKLVYRHSSSEKLRKVYRAYFGRKHRGNLFEIISADNKLDLESKGKTATCDNEAFPSDFAKKVTQCNKECSSCTYCADVARAAIQISADADDANRCRVGNWRSREWFSRLFGLGREPVTRRWWVGAANLHDDGSARIEILGPGVKFNVILKPASEPGLGARTDALTVSCEGVIAQPARDSLLRTLTRRLKGVNASHLMKLFPLTQSENEPASFGNARLKSEKNPG